MIRIILAFVLLALVVVGTLELFPQSLYQHKKIVDRIHEKPMVINAIDNRYHFFMLTNHLEENANYLLTFDALTLTQGESEVAVAALLDVHTQSIVAEKLLPLHPLAQKAWYFTVPSSEDGLELLLYPSLRGETDWVGLDAKGAALVKDVQNPRQNPQNLLSPSLSNQLYMPAGQESNHYHVLAQALTPGQGYSLLIGQASALHGSPLAFTLEVYDNKQDKAIDTSVIPLAPDGLAKDIAWSFTLPQQEGSFSLRVYRGPAGQTENNSLLFEDLALVPIP